MSDLISPDAAIDALCKVGCGSGHCGISCDDVKAIEQLPSTQPEPCEYCNEDMDGFVTSIDKNGHAFVRFGMNGWELSLKANGWHGSAKIRYCPMCGRDLFVK